MIYASPLLYLEGLTVGISSLFGVYFGIKAKNKIKIKYLKILLVILYIIVLSVMICKLT